LFNLKLNGQNLGFNTPLTRNETAHSRWISAIAWNRNWKANLKLKFCWLLKIGCFWFFIVIKKHGNLMSFRQYC